MNKMKIPILLNYTYILFLQPTLSYFFTNLFLSARFRTSLLFHTHINIYIVPIVFFSLDQTFRTVMYFKLRFVFFSRPIPHLAFCGSDYSMIYALLSVDFNTHGYHGNEYTDSKTYYESLESRA